MFPSTVVVVERISQDLVAGSEASDFNWCNTNNHESDITDEEYLERIERTARSKWLPFLPHLCGSSKHSYTISVPSSLVSQYFRRASEFAEKKLAVHRVMGDDFADCAEELLSKEEIKSVMFATPPSGFRMVCDHIQLLSKGR